MLKVTMRVVVGVTTVVGTARLPMYSSTLVPWKMLMGWVVAIVTGGFTPSSVASSMVTLVVVVPLVEAWKLKFHVPPLMTSTPTGPDTKDATLPSAVLM